MKETETIDEERDRESGAEGGLSATENEIGTAIILRNALTATEEEGPDILKLASQLATILAPYGLDYTDLYAGMKLKKRKGL